MEASAPPAAAAAGHDDGLAEYREFRRLHPAVKFVDIFLTDPDGILRGKRIAIAELESVYRNGRPLPGTMIGLDITGADVDETRLGWDDGDADRPARPVPGTLMLQPWADEPSAQLLLGYFERDGSPHPLDPRHILARTVAALAADGLAPMGAVELEFFLVDGAAWRQNRLALAAGHDGGKQGYAMAEIDAVTPFLDDLYRTCAVQGLPAMSTISEYAPGQFEVTLHHRADILRAADEAVLYKRAVKAVARRHGLGATFMAKPFADQSGSGMHLHLSLVDTDGANRFEAVDGEQALRWAIGGMIASMRESMLLFAPNANSYRRFQPNSYAPVAPTWGHNNRTVAFRVPDGPKGSRRIEHRVAGADANPYLALAGVLAAMHRGLAERIDPGPPVAGNGYRDHTGRFPPCWIDAIRDFEGSTFLRGALGGYFCDMFAAIKRGEYLRFEAVVPPLDLEWYLRGV